MLSLTIMCNLGAGVQQQLLQANMTIGEQHQQLTSKSYELEQKSEEVQQLTQRCHELEWKNREHQQQLTLKCHELKRENEQAEELEKRHHELELENKALEEQLVQANMRADEFDKLRQENEALLEHHQLQANVAAEEILQQATQRSSELEETYQSDLSHANMQLSEAKRENQVLQHQASSKLMKYL